VPGGIAVDGDTAYAVGREGAAIVSIPLIDGSPGRSKLGRPNLDRYPTFGPNGLVVTGGPNGDGTLEVSYLDSNEPPVVLVPTQATHDPFVSTIAISSDGRFIASAGFAGVLSVFDTASMRLVHSIPYATDRPIDSDLLQGLTDAEAGRHASVAWVSETTAILYAFDSVTSIDLATGEKRWEARGFRDIIYAVSVSTDETLVIASDFYGTTQLLRFDDGTRVGALLANGSLTASERGTAPVVRGNFSVFLPGSHVALIVDWDTGIARLVDVDSRTDVSPPFTAVSGLTFWNLSADGHVAIVAGQHGGVRLYDLQTGAPIGDPFPGNFPLTLGTPTPDGRSLIVLGFPNTIWDIDPASWREKACTVAGRNLTKREWQQYMPVDEPYRAVCPAYPVQTS